MFSFSLISTLPVRNSLKGFTISGWMNYWGESYFVLTVNVLYLEFPPSLPPIVYVFKQKYSFRALSTIFLYSLLKQEAAPELELTSLPGSQQSFDYALYSEQVSWEAWLA